MSQLLPIRGARLLQKPFCGASYDRLPPITGRTLRSVRELRGYTRGELALAEGLRERTVVNHEKILEPKKTSNLSRSVGFTETYWKILMEPLFFAAQLHRSQEFLMSTVPAQQVSIGVRVKDNIIFELPASSYKLHVPVEGDNLIRLAFENPNFALSLTNNGIRALGMDCLVPPDPDSCLDTLTSVMAYMHVSETAFPGLIYVLAYNKLDTGSPNSGGPATFSEKDILHIWKEVDSNILPSLPLFYWELLMHFAAR